jgi:hypothetical protein
VLVVRGPIEAVSSANIRETFDLEVQPAAIEGLCFADGVIPCQCVLHEDTVVGPTGAYCVCVGYLKRASRVGEKVAEGEKSFADCMRQKPPGFGEQCEADPCCDLGPLNCYPDHLA